MTTANSSAPLYLLTVLHDCVRRQDSVSAMLAGVTAADPGGETTAGGERGAEEHDTDTGAVMYIAAVLVFYSLGIVVMIIKYLKTERKEIEEEMMLENFFKGIPSKRIEHEREAVHRVAIRAFHTLTSNAAQNEQLLLAAAAAAPDACARAACDKASLPEDSDESSGVEDPSVTLRRERLKYLPRVSLMFRENRSLSERRKQDSVRSMRGRSPHADQSDSATSAGAVKPYGEGFAGRDVTRSQGVTDVETSFSSVDAGGSRSGATGDKARTARRCKRDSLRMCRSSVLLQCNDDQESGFGSGTPDEGSASPRLPARGVSSEGFPTAGDRCQPVSGAHQQAGRKFHESAEAPRRLLVSDV